MNIKRDHSELKDLQVQVLKLQEEVKQLKRAQVQDKLSVAKYQSVYNHAYDSFFLNELNSEGPVGFIEVNQRAVDLFGYSIHEFKSLHFYQLLDEDTVSAIKSDWHNLQKHQTQVYESRSQTKSGGVIFIEISMVLIEIEGAEVLLSSIRDISSNKMAQKELQVAKERAEESEKLKSAFLANISHEIRTPMNAIAGFSNLLIQDDLDASVRIEYVNIINTNTNLLLRLITDILDISKIESGTLKIIHKRLNINRLMANLYDVFTSELRRLNKPHIKLLYSKTLADDKAFIITDPVRLSQILNNLIFNSIKFTDKGFVEYGYDLKDDNTIQFFVKDSGIGIVKEKQDVIFEHFRQENEEVTKKNHGGTGLGLSISKKLVELLGGNIWVESETNVGSTFNFTLNYYKTDGKSFKSGRELKFNWSGKTILLVEDSAQTINLFSIVLFETNVSLLVARTAEEALHLCSSNPSIDLVIMDMELPDINGFKATESLRNIRPDIQVIGQSDDVNKCNPKQLLDMGIKHMLSKPINRDALFEVLLNYLESKLAD